MVLFPARLVSLATNANAQLRSRSACATVRAPGATRFPVMGCR